MIELAEETLSEVAGDYTAFTTFFKDYVWGVSFGNAYLIPRYSRARMMDAHHFWREDLERLRLHSMPAGKTPDHFKQAAHLAYWLRRSGPVVDFDEPDNPQDGLTRSVGPSEQAFRDLLFHYGTEYLAFDLGYLICRFYEENKLDPASVKPFDLDPDYIRTVCCFLKEKNVSPHALYLLYKSLLYKRFT